MSEDAALIIEINPEVRRRLEDLHATSLYGETVDETAKILFLEGLCKQLVDVLEWLE